VGPAAGLDTFEKREKSLAGNRTEPRSIGCSDRSQIFIPAPLLYTSLTVMTKLTFLSHQSLNCVFCTNPLKKSHYFSRQHQLETRNFHSPLTEK